jgi:DnaJ-class molecular chaperone
MKSTAQTLELMQKATATKTEVCQACLGEGERYSHRNGRKIVSCPDCNGTGKISTEV